MFEEEPYADDIFGDGMGGKKECPSNKAHFARKVCLPMQCTYGPRQSDGYCPPRPKSPKRSPKKPGKIYDDAFDDVISGRASVYKKTARMKKASKIAAKMKRANAAKNRYVYKKKPKLRKRK